MATSIAPSASSRRQEEIPTSSRKKEKGDDDDRGAVDSADEALLEVLGLYSLDVVGDDDDDVENDDDGDEDGGDATTRLPLSELGIPSPSSPPQHRFIEDVLSRSGAVSEYASQCVCLLPAELSVPASTMRRLTDELVWGGGGGGFGGSGPGRGAPNHGGYSCDRTYETIRVLKRGDVEPTERRVLTRLENFAATHPGWDELCNVYLARCVSLLLGEEYVLYKEKLNLKPPGGSGFAPHLDAPSLRVALGERGPRTFVTVMVAIDDMTSRNGCLRVARAGGGKEEEEGGVVRPWSEDNRPEVIEPERDGNPDAGGRAGAVPPEAADALDFRDLECRGGTVGVFGGWVPHRSKANASPFPRRAVFLTYNPRREGTFREAYYGRMAELRDGFRRSLGLLSDDERAEMEALKSVPRI